MKALWMTLAISIGPVLALVAYGGLYANVVEVHPFAVHFTGEVNEDGHRRAVRDVLYPDVRGVRGRYIRAMFAPAHWADQQLRPNVWIEFLKGLPPF